MGNINGIIRINTYYIHTYFQTAIISNICSDPRCDSGEPDDYGVRGPAIFREGDYAFSKGNGNRRRLLCLVCAHHQHYVSDEEMIPRLNELQGMKH